MGVMGVIIGLVIGVIGLVIVQAVITDGNFTGLLGTVTENIGNRLMPLRKVRFSASVPSCAVRCWPACPCSVLGSASLKLAGYPSRNASRSVLMGGRRI